MKIRTSLGILGALVGGLTSVSGEANARPLPLDYAPYHHAGQAPGGGNDPTEAQIRADIIQLWKYTDEIRTYNVDAPGLVVVKVCEDEGMSINLGSYLAREEVGTRPSFAGIALDKVANQAGNAAVIQALITVSNNGYDVVKSLLIANELLLWDEIKTPALIAYYNQVHDATQHRYQMTFGETWNSGWVQHPELGMTADFVLFHMHPYWEGNGIDNAVFPTDQKSIAQVWGTMRTKFPGKRLVQGETGWPTAGVTNLGNVPTIANQKKFITDLRTYMGTQATAGTPLEVYFFEAYDEPWKGDEGASGPSWGILDNNGAAKSDAVAARVVPQTAVESPAGTITVTLDTAAMGATATTITKTSSWEITGGVITNVTLSADGKTVTITYTGGDAFKGLRATDAASDVVARRRLVLGSMAARPVVGPNGMMMGSGGTGGGGASGATGTGGASNGGASGSGTAGAVATGGTGGASSAGSGGVSSAGAGATTGGASSATAGTTSGGPFTVAPESSSNGSSCAVSHAPHGARFPALVALLAALSVTLRRRRRG